ncbi:MAG: phytanoyl-CoA dioxygenase family protein [Verrucomicrobiota bacterium]
MNATEYSDRRPRLSPDQVARFQTEGYLLPSEKVFPAGKFRRLQEYFEELLQAWPAGERPEGMDVPHFTNPKLFEWLFAPEVLDLVEPLIGPDIALFSSHFICKPKGDGRRVPWHEDSAYWSTMLAPMEVVTVWLAIDPSTTENGCMYVIPHTHNTGKHGYSDYDPVDTSRNVFPTEITPSQREDRRAIPCVLEPGQCSLHDGRLIHGSPPNTSQRRRCGYTMRYIPARVKLNEQARQWHQLYLAHGRDLAGNVYADPNRAYPELMPKRTNLGRKGH